MPFFKKQFSRFQFVVPIIVGIIFLSGCSSVHSEASDTTYSGLEWKALSKIYLETNAACPMGGGCSEALSRTFDATSSGKTEANASINACIEAKKVAQTFHSGVGFKNITKTKKELSGWTATCEIKEFTNSSVKMPGDNTKVSPKGPTVTVNSDLCRDKNGSCKEVNTLIFRTFNGVPVPIQNIQNTPFVWEAVESTTPDGIETKQLIPSIVTTGLSEVFTPVVVKSGRILVAFTIKLSNLNQIKTLKDGVQFPAVKHLLSVSGHFGLAPGQSKTVDLGNGFHLTLSAKVLTKASGNAGA